MSAISRRATLAGLLATAPFIKTVQAAVTDLNFGIIAIEGSQSLRTKWEPFLQDMEKAVGVKVNGFYPSDYAGVVEAMRFNKIQIAWHGNASAIPAVDRAEGEVFVQKTYANGELGYYSIIIVHRDSSITSLNDIITSTPGTYNLGNGDPNSASGFLIPGYYAWARNNVDVRKLFKNIVTANHGTNLLAVANRQVDVATNNNEDLEAFRRTQPARAALVREVWRSPLIPGDPMVWRKDLPPDLKQKIRAFFLEYGTEREGADTARERKVLFDLGGWGAFRASSNTQLLPIRQVQQYRDRLAAENNPNLSADDKAKRLQEIDDRLKALDQQMEDAKAVSN